MSESSSVPATDPSLPTPTHIDLSKLDDKHLSQYRHPNELRALAGIVVGLIAIFAVLWGAQTYVGNLIDLIPNPLIRAIDHWFHPTRIGMVLAFILLLMWTMDAIGQSSRAWQLVAQAVEVTPTTFPQLAPIVDTLRTRFDLPRTRVYVSRDAPAKGYTIGIRQPYAIVFSSITVGSVTADEFKFLLGREMGSIKLGHTLMATLLGNVRMSLPQPFSMLLRFRSILFSTYHHAQELSCDRIGVVATRDVRPALSSLVKQNIGAVRGAKIDVKSLAPQSKEFHQGLSGRMLQTTMLFNPQPWPVARLYELVKWAGDPPAAASAPAAPAVPTPAASANAAAASAAAAAASAAAAAASAAEMAALFAKLSEAGLVTVATDIAAEAPTENGASREAAEATPPSQDAAATMPESERVAPPTPAAAAGPVAAAAATKNTNSDTAAPP